MPDQTFMDFFAGQRMTLLAQSATVKSGIPRVLPPALYTPGPTRPFNDKVQWPAVTWNRGGATVIARGSPPHVINVGATDWKFGTVLNMAEEFSIDFEFMQALASDFMPVKENAMMELNRRMMMFNQRFETTRTNMVHSLFANGVVWIGADGQILASSTGAVITMDASVPTANKFTKDGAGSTYNIGDWSAAATNIQKALRTLQNTSIQTTGYMPTNILYGTSIPDFLSTNNTLAPYLARNPSFRDELIATNEVPKGFLGYNWTPARLAFNVKLANVNDTTGTVVQTFADNFLAAMPDPNPEWYEFIEGGSQIPNGVAGATQVQPGATMQQMMNAFSIAYGKYSYGVVKSYPTIGQAMIQGDCCGPIFKTPGAYFFGTCS